MKNTIPPYRKSNSNAFYVLLFFLFVIANGYSQELLVDGNMEHYSAGSSFEFDSGGYTTLFPPLLGISIPGNNAQTDNPVNFNSGFLSVDDHSATGVQMLVVDGGNLRNGQYFWKIGHGVTGLCGLGVGKTYTFSYWIRSISPLVTDPSTQADIGIDFTNATDILLVSGNMLAPLPVDGWQKVTYRFKATDSCVKINLWDNNTNLVGNDFALDDFSLLEGVSLTATYSLSFGSKGTELFPYGIGGNPKIASWKLRDAITGADIPNLDHLEPGNYILTVVDLDGAMASCDVLIPVKPPLLTINGDTDLCKGESTVLTASGGNGVYEWFSFPRDPSITDPLNPVQVVTPAVTTNYILKSYYAPGTENLIYNGDFSMGNTGFDTDQKYYLTNSENLANAYSVLQNPADWDSNFLNCGDHTSGNGNMLVVNGNDFNLSVASNSLIWEQMIRVEGTTDYQFSFWVKSLSNVNPAKLFVLINGVVYNATSFDAPADDACTSWIKYSVDYSSGTVSDLADIQIINSNNAFLGNDFAIDDISFSKKNLEIETDIFVRVTPLSKPYIGNNVLTMHDIQFNWDKITGATGYEISYTVNNGPTIHGGTVTTNSFFVGGLNPDDLVKLRVKPIGYGCYEADEFIAKTYPLCPVPVASVVTQPTCLAPVGSIKLDSPLGIEYEYSLDGNTFQPGVLFSNLPEGNYTITIHNTITNCREVSNPLTLNSPRAILPDITASYAYQDCAILLTASSSIVNSTIVWNGPSLAVNTSNPVKVAVAGKFTATVTDLITGCDNSFDLDVIMPVPPALPSVTGTDPTCTNAFGSIVVNAPLNTNYEYRLDGQNYQSANQFSNLAPASYNITVRDILTGCVSAPVQITLIKPTIPAPVAVVQNDRLCKNSNAAPLDATPLPNATLNWYGTAATGGTASNVATVPSTSVLGTTTYYVSQTIGLCESERTPIAVNVSGDRQNPGFTDLNLCQGNAIPALNEISPNGIKGIWEPASIDDSANGSYHFTPNLNECAIEQTINVTINKATLKSIDWEVSKAFGDNQIKIKASDEGNYLYQLDDGTPQKSPLFENITRGYHSITVMDINGCSEPISKDRILLINFPNYFTPNSDGYNDFWDISDLKSQNEAVVFIYDRYGKLLKQLFPSKDLGWDGTYLGREMPSTDYWFVVSYNENGNKEEFKGHFSLKR